MNIQIEKKSLFFSAFIATMIPLSILMESYIVDFLFASIVLIILLHTANWQSAVNMMFLVGFATFIYAPALVNGYFFKTDFLLYYLSSLMGFLFIILTRRAIHTPQFFDGKSTGPYFIVMA